MSVFDTKDETTLYSADEIQNNKVVCIIGYIGFLFFVPLVAAPESGYAKFHANQALLLFIVEMVMSVISGIFSACGVMPVIGFIFTICAGILGSIFGVISLVFMIIGMLNAGQGAAKELPIIGKFRILR